MVMTRVVFYFLVKPSIPATALLARMYLGQQRLPSRALGTTLVRFLKQEESDWGFLELLNAPRSVLHHNWRQYQQLSAGAAVVPAMDEDNKITTI
ncbi:hypothetical protein F441_20296 [Phytophthora nicotianae CJ01A1]|uniref:Uncharacterized protein n=1 Tax=Phytophthora nicotianae CJ01A1 TaxID=1317063 RepID=W2VY28_PHYNI|nr:hypothetical protein F441_20296 [Phytophthora nicotianae CJ01A1]